MSGPVLTCFLIAYFCTAVCLFPPDTAVDVKFMLFIDGKIVFSHVYNASLSISELILKPNIRKGKIEEHVSSLMPFTESSMTVVHFLLVITVVL